VAGQVPLITKGFFEQCQKSETSGPTFEAHFADGTVTRTTTHCPNGKLDLGRGVRPARIAYCSRHFHDAGALPSAVFALPGAAFGLPGPALGVIEHPVRH
jgi:hypothetical protein